MLCRCLRGFLELKCETIPFISRVEAMNDPSLMGGAVMKDSSKVTASRMDHPAGATLSRRKNIARPQAIRVLLE